MGATPPPPPAGAAANAGAQEPGGAQGSRPLGSSLPRPLQPCACSPPAAALLALGAWGMLALLALRPPLPPDPSLPPRLEGAAPPRGLDGGSLGPEPLRRGQHGAWEGPSSAANRSSAPHHAPLGARPRPSGAALEASRGAADRRSRSWLLWPWRRRTEAGALPGSGGIPAPLLGPWHGFSLGGTGQLPGGRAKAMAWSLYCHAYARVSWARHIPGKGPGPCQPAGDSGGWPAWGQHSWASLSGRGEGGRRRSMRESRSNDWLISAWLNRGAPGVRKAASRGLGQYLYSFFRRREADGAGDGAPEEGPGKQGRARKSTGEKGRRRRQRGRGLEYSWHWPQQLVGRTWKSPFVTDARILPMEQVPSCKQGSLPPDLHPSPLVRGRNVTTDDLLRLKEQYRLGRVPQGDSEDDPPLRVLVWYPRFGLGNSLRGFTSSLVYAFLSGRQMLRWHGGSHAEVLDSLCMGFKCGLDVLEFSGDIRHVSHGMGVRTHQLIKSLHLAAPVVHISSGSFFDFWLKEPEILQCVLDAFQCQDRWCVRTRALQVLLGNGPTEELSAALEDVLDVASPVPLPAASAPGLSATLPRPQPAPPHHSSALTSAQQQPQLGTLPDSQQIQDASKKSPGTSEQNQEGSKQSGQSPKVLRRTLLGSPAVDQLRKPFVRWSGGSPGGRRSLAADARKDEAEEDEEEEGRVEPMDKGAGMRLQFDVAIHIRTHSKYLENVRCITRQGDCQKVAEAKSRAEAMHVGGHLASRSWVCLSAMLSFAHRSKFQEQTARDGESRISDPENLKMLLAHDSLDPGPLADDAGPRGGNVSEGGAEPSSHPDLNAITAKWRAKVAPEAPWTAENAVAFAAEALAGTLPEQRTQRPTGSRTRRRRLSDAGKASDEDEEEDEDGAGEGGPSRASPSRGTRLAILLATDSESLRPQLVEFLRPFGVVFYSSGKVAHLSKSRGATEKKLPTLVEFYLLSKAALLVSHVRYISTFALFAAMYGNGTLTSGGSVNSCRFHVEHLMEPPREP